MRARCFTKRLVCAAVLVTVISSMLAGCHGKRAASEFSMPEDLILDGEYEISFWAKNDTNKNQTMIYDKAISDFERLYPNIHVNLRLYTDYGKIYNDVITNIQTMTTPNVCITYPDHIATYRSGSGVVVPLNDLMNDPAYGLGGSLVKFDGPSRDDIIPQYLSECILGDEGDICALPFMRSSEALYVNKTLVEKLGYELPEDMITWDFVWEVSDAAAATLGSDGVYGINGQKVLIPFIYKSTDNMMIQYLKQQDAGYSDADGNVYLFNDDTSAFLKEVAAHTQTGAFSTFKISGYPSNFLNAGQCLFAVDSTAGSTWVGSDAPLLDISPDRIVQFETAVYPVPQIDVTSPRMISQGPSVCLFNKADPGEVIASWLFLQYLLTNDVQIAYSQTEGYVPVTKKARESAEYVEYLAKAGEDNDLNYSVKLEATSLVLDHTGDTFVTPVFNGSASLRDAAGALIEETVKGTRRKKTVDDAFLKKLYQDTGSLYRLDELKDRAKAGDDEAVDEPLPAMSVGLLVCLALVWAGILVYVIAQKLRKT